MIVTGVGQHQMWAAQYYRFKHPRTWCTSGGLGTMGYGLPTAMGVQAGNPEQAGDQHRRRRLLPDEQPGAGHLLHGAPAREDRHHQQRRARHGAAVAAHHLQGALLRDRPAADPRLREAGRGLRLRGASASPSRARWCRRSRRCSSTPGPVVLDVWVDKDECVFPMVPAGGANTDMILAPPSREVREKRGQVADGLLMRERRASRASTPSPCSSRTSSACSPAWPGCSRPAATTSRACRWARRSTPACRA